MPDFWYIQPEDRVVTARRGWKDAQGVKHPASAFDLWSEAELRAKGVYPGRYDPAFPGEGHEVATEGAATVVGNEAIIKRAYRQLPPDALPSIQASRLAEEDRSLRRTVSRIADAETRTALRTIMKRIGVSE